MNCVTKELLEDFIQNNWIELSPTHSRLCIPVIDRIFRKMMLGIHFAGIKVEGSVICDGHHRFVASLLAGKPLQNLPGITTSATQIFDWTTVKFEEEDWDTAAKIRMLNEQDAAFNDIPTKQLLELLR